MCDSQKLKNTKKKNRVHKQVCFIYIYILFSLPSDVQSNVVLKIVKIIPFVTTFEYGCVLHDVIIGKDRKQQKKYYKLFIIISPMCFNVQ